MAGEVQPLNRPSPGVCATVIRAIKGEAVAKAARSLDRPAVKPCSRLYVHSLQA